MQFTRFTIFHVFYLIGMLGGAWLGADLGRHFGRPGVIIGSIVGFVVGFFVSHIPSHLAYRAMFRDVEKSSNERLRQIIDQPDWNFRNTLALLNLSARGVDVNADLSRIIAMLESESYFERIYGWDALRLVYTPISKRLPQYNPKLSAANCQEQIANLRASLQT